MLKIGRDGMKVYTFNGNEYELLSDDGCFLYDYIVRENKNGPFNCTILTICGMIDTRGMFHDYYILWA